LPFTFARRTLWRAPLLATLVGSLAASPVAATEQATERYALGGYEVWYSPTMAVFAGTSRVAGADLSAWYATIEHSLVINPSGTVTGGFATLYLPDGVRITGRFSDGTIVQTDPGVNCTTEYHAIAGNLRDVSRSDVGAVGTAALSATLVHHRAWIFGRCLSYAASVEGTIEISL